MPEPDFPALPAGLGDRAVELAHRWALAAATHPVDGAAKLLADALSHPGGLEFTTAFIDQVVRPEDDRVAAANLRQIVRRVPPTFLPWHLRTAATLGAAVGERLPGLVVPASRRVVRRLVDHLIGDSRPGPLGRTIKEITATGRRLNLNLLGEAVLGDEEARARFDGTMAMLARPDVDYVSIKVSAVVSQLNLWAYEETVDAVVERLTPLYELAARATTPKFINLDMEEYHDLHLTIDVFKRLLELPALHDLSAGIVLQAYLPDALGCLQELTAWAQGRVADGGAPVKVRVVKGANLAMERVDAATHGWELVTWPTKELTDANYKRVLSWALQPEHTRAVRLGVAGHNLFDVAFIHLLAEERGVSDAVEFEMLLGMAEGQQVEVTGEVGGLLLYVPVVPPDQFDAAISYLVRRLEENAADTNFMSAVFDIGTNDALFGRERDRFRAALADVTAEVPRPRRTQDRVSDPAPAPQTAFANVPDTDPSLPENRPWIRGIIAAAEHTAAGEETVAAHEVTDAAGVDAVVASARAAAAGWAGLPAAERARILRAVAVALEAHRADLLEVAAGEAGKILPEGDGEVSEAIDFANYYAERALDLEGVPGATFTPAAVTLITPPWNFPVSIPAGGVLAALATGSAVVFKPAPQARRTGSVVAEILWEAGVPREALQLIHVPENEVGRHLITHPGVDRIILTGAYDTAALFHSWRPETELLAETSGKNSVIVMPSCDVDQAVAHVVHSAFGHAGQKCSAASLVILVGAMGKSERFVRQLVDAARTLIPDHPWNPRATMSPLVEAPVPGSKLARGLQTLEPGQTWLLEPRQLDEQGVVWTPGIRDGVVPGSEFHRVEYFGPVLGIVRVDTLEEAIAVQNGTDYGLTAGMETLDPGDLATWLEQVEAGNVYVNRGITGAIVRRQPFGGWKHSAVGPGAKAGGPNYLLRLGSWARDDASLSSSVPAVTGAPYDALVGALDGEDRAWVSRAVASDAAAWVGEFGVNRDVSALGVERNIFRYRPVPVVVRAGERASVAEVVRVVAAGLRAGSSVRVSAADDLPEPVAGAIRAAGVAVSVQDEAAWLAAVPGLAGPRIRLIGGDLERLTKVLADRVDVAVYHDEVTGAGRIELLPFLHEQAVAITAHRFGEPDAWSEPVISSVG